MINCCFEFDNSIYFISCTQEATDENNLCQMYIGWAAYMWPTALHVLVSLMTSDSCASVLALLVLSFYDCCKKLHKLNCLQICSNLTLFNICISSMEWLFCLVGRKFWFCIFLNSRLFKTSLSIIWMNIEIMLFC